MKNILIEAIALLLAGIYFTAVYAVIAYLITH